MAEACANTLDRASHLNEACQIHIDPNKNVSNQLMIAMLSELSCRNVWSVA